MTATSKTRSSEKADPHRLVTGEPLPDAVEVLPAVGRLHGYTVAEVGEAQPAFKFEESTPEQEAEAERVRLKFENEGAS